MGSQIVIILIFNLFKIFFIHLPAHEILATLLPIFQSIRESAGMLAVSGPRSRVSVVSLPTCSSNTLPRVPFSVTLILFWVYFLVL